MYSVHHHFHTIHTLSWCQRVVRISRNRENLTAIESTTTTMVYSISRGISRGLQIFRLLLRPSAMTTAYWRRKERVYFGGLEMGLEKAV